MTISHILQESPHPQNGTDYPSCNSDIVMATISSSRRLNDQSCDRTALLLEFDITVCIQMLVVQLRGGGGGGVVCCHLFIFFLFIFEIDNFYTVQEYILLQYDQ